MLCFTPYNRVTYHGWEIFEMKIPTIANPREGQTLEPVNNFIASRHGVNMNTNTLDGIKRMVDQRNYYS